LAFLALLLFLFVAILIYSSNSSLDVECYQLIMTLLAPSYLLQLIDCINCIFAPFCFKIHLIIKALDRQIDFSSVSDTDMLHLLSFVLKCFSWCSHHQLQFMDHPRTHPAQKSFLWIQTIHTAKRRSAALFSFNVKSC